MVDGVISQYELTRTWDVLNDVISTNLTDPSVPKRQKVGDWIKNGFPNPGDLDKKDGWKFPIVVISTSDIDDEIVTVDQGISEINHSVSIISYSKTRLEANQLAEEIRHILKSTAKDDLNKACLYVPDINGSSEDSDFISGNKYYGKTIDYSFRRFD